MKENESIKKHALSELCEQYAKTSQNVSRITQMWALTIIVPVLTYILKEQSECMLWPILIAGLSLFSLLIDSLQYMYVLEGTKNLLGNLNDGKITVEDLPGATRVIHEKSFSLIVAKFVILLINTVLLLVFLALKI